MEVFAITWKLLVVLSICGNVLAFWSEFEMVKAGGMNQTDSRPFHFEVLLKRHSPGVYKFFSNITVTGPLKDYMAEAQLHYSSNSNNRYSATPIRIPRGPLCSKINNEYRRYIMDETRKSSDLPVTDNPRANLCAMFERKTYRVTNFEYRTSVLPQFLGTGLYKALIVLSKDGVVTSGTEGIFRLS